MNIAENLAHKTADWIRKDLPENMERCLMHLIYVIAERGIEEAVNEINDAREKGGVELRQVRYWIQINRWWEKEIKE